MLLSVIAAISQHRETILDACVQGSCDHSHISGSSTIRLCGTLIRDVHGNGKSEIGPIESELTRILFANGAIDIVDVAALGTGSLDIKLCESRLRPCASRLRNRVLSKLGGLPSCGKNGRKEYRLPHSDARLNTDVQHAIDLADSAQDLTLKDNPRWGDVAKKSRDALASDNLCHKASRLLQHALHAMQHMSPELFRVAQLNAVRRIEVKSIINRLEQMLIAEDWCAFRNAIRSRLAPYRREYSDLLILEIEFAWRLECIHRGNDTELGELFAWIMAVRGHVGLAIESLKDAIAQHPLVADLARRMSYAILREAHDYSLRPDRQCVADMALSTICTYLITAAPIEKIRSLQHFLGNTWIACRRVLRNLVMADTVNCSEEVLTLLMKKKAFVLKHMKKHAADPSTSQIRSAIGLQGPDKDSLYSEVVMAEKIFSGQIDFLESGTNPMWNRHASARDKLLAEQEGFTSQTSDISVQMVRDIIRRTPPEIHDLIERWIGANGGILLDDRVPPAEAVMTVLHCSISQADAVVTFIAEVYPIAGTDME